ncbi:transglycosylase SLT domain-containing protein [Kitasatospora sp. MAP5-34]|uniref:transglycosylase SLT domain-containing protein n=1 Tax=Kitasatospora sp. MAP5-34 TaxID=3035102 RepID=UPI002475FA8B|nr:transglycosylase SLT domain-containing protein [Kitasatospora sp. MAP5-34]MDH6577854.1 hypothetical protein [Kitasatospora sp. MAP5-34]
MGPQRKYGRALALVVAVVAVWLVARGGHTPAHPGTGATPQSPTPTADRSAAPSPSASNSKWSDSYDPAHFATQVRTRAGQAGIDPRLLMAILYNEDYKPHDPQLERAWQRLKPDSAFGIANMHRAAFDETKQGHDFATRNWDELPDDPDLAIEAAAWYLHDLADQLPAHRSAPFNEDELLALGYNTGAGNMLAFARGVTPGSAARSYLDRLHENLTKADAALSATG